MTELTASLSRIPDARAMLESFARRNANALVLGCMLSAALLVWLVPAAPETRCLLVKSQALGMKTAVSLSLALTGLAWWARKPALRLAAALRRKEPSAPSD